VKVPSYRQKPDRDYAIVEWRGVRHRLPGAYDSVESRESYRQFLAERVFGTPDQQSSPSLSVARLVTQYLDHAREYYQNGTRHSEYANLRVTLLWLGVNFGEISADKLGPLTLKKIQTALIKLKHSRGYVNTEVARIRRLYRWAVSEQLVKPDVLSALQSVQPLRAGHSVAQERARRIGVEWDVVCQTLAYCSPQIADMILIQWYTGVRSDSLCLMEGSQLEVDTSPWIWRPRHKTEHLGVVAEIPIGPRCQRILERHLPAVGYVFSPRVARSNPRYRENYTSASYYQHISRAMDRAASFGHAIPHWFPHQIRHSRARIVEREWGVEGARVALAHASLDATKVYSSRDLELAKSVATDLG